jgi:hypothetical protein
VSSNENRETFDIRPLVAMERYYKCRGRNLFPAEYMGRLKRGKRIEFMSADGCMETLTHTLSNEEESQMSGKKLFLTEYQNH